MRVSASQTLNRRPVSMLDSGKIFFWRMDRLVGEVVNFLREVLVFCLLASVIIPILVSSPTVISQGLTTVTSLQSATTSYITYSTSTSLLPLQYVHYPDDFDRSTNTFHLTNELQRVVLAPFQKGEYQLLRCEFYDYFAFNGIKSELVQGQLTSGPFAVNFRIMPRAQFDNWGSTEYRRCGKPWTAFVNATASSYSFNWTLPENGEYVFLFDVHSYGGTGLSSVTVQFSAYMVSSSTVAKTVTSTLTQAVASTATVVSS